MVGEVNDLLNVQVALVILERGNGRIALQLRDAKPTILSPDCWGLFGGKVEAGESPKEAALREIQEELTVALDAKKLKLVRVFRPTSNKSRYVFHYPVVDELETTVLREGQRYKFIHPSTIKSGIIEQKAVSPLHTKILNWFIGR